jgi:hypothetical protein
MPLFSVILIFNGCKSDVCSSDNIDENRPTRDISCPNGKVCYGGECIAACNAGSERFVSCMDESECTNSARPFCVKSFCTACEESSYCVPSLNICAPVKTNIPGDEVPLDNELPVAKEPLDAGPIDGAVFSTDTGVNPVQEEKPTHIVQLDIAQIVNYVQGQAVDDAAVEISSTNVEFAQYVESATVAQPFVGGGYRCDLQTIAKFVGTSSPADIGNLGFGNGDLAQGLVGQETYYVASFVGSQYALSPPIPTQLLNFSTLEPPSLSYILFAAAGSTELGIPKLPVGQDGLVHVPYRLQPGVNSNESIDTPQELKDGYRVNRQAPDKLVFLWDFARNVAGVKIIVRVTGSNHEIRCVGTDQFERIEIVSRLLTQFANVEGLGAGAVLPVHLDRVYGRQLDVPIEMGKDTLVDLSIKVRHSHRSVLRYE